MGQANNSFNFRLWAKDTDSGEQIDLIDNDYFELIAYRANETKKYWRDPDIQFVHCPPNLEDKTRNYK